MTDLFSFSSGSAGRPVPPDPDDPAVAGRTNEPDQNEPGHNESAQNEPGQNEPAQGESGQPRGTERADSGQRIDGDANGNSNSEPPAENRETDRPSDSDQPSDVAPLPEFVDDPIVPLRLRLPGTVRHTLYHPGWYGIEEGEESQAFLGVPGEVLYGFERLTHLVDYMRTGVPTGLAPGPDLAAVRSWTAEQYAARLCDYDMVSIPELANGELSADEQGSLGSMLAVGLDLMDFLRIQGEHADALRQDEDISKLASGDEVLSVFAAGRHRQHVVEMIEAHWSPCMVAISARAAVPKAER